MSEQVEQRTEAGDGWPMPSPDVLRELEPPTTAWAETEWLVSSQPLRRPATG